MQTIDQAGDVPVLPLLSDTQATALSASAAPLVDLPFAPAISMDPVDGGKVSIRPDTPVAEFRDRVYYFQSEENRQAFLRNPEKYAAGSLSRY
jgi:YHS domain-containing protein